MSGEFSYGLCGCFGDIRLCCLTFFAPCVTVGRNAEYFGEDCVTATLLNCCCGCPYEIIVRNRLRHLRGIQGTMTTDLMMALFCGFCMLVQDAREIEESKKAGLPSGDTMVTSTTVMKSMARQWGGPWAEAHIVAYQGPEHGQTALWRKCILSLGTILKTNRMRSTGGSSHRRQVLNKHRLFSSFQRFFTLLDTKIGTGFMLYT